MGVSIAFQICHSKWLFVLLLPQWNPLNTQMFYQITRFNFTRQFLTHIFHTSNNGQTNSIDNTKITTKSNNTSRCSWLNVAIDTDIKTGLRKRLTIALTSALSTVLPTTYSVVLSFVLTLARITTLTIAGNTG